MWDIDFDYITSLQSAECREDLPRLLFKSAIQVLWMPFGFMLIWFISVLFFPVNVVESIWKFRELPTRRQNKASKVAAKLRKNTADSDDGSI